MGYVHGEAFVGGFGRAPMKKKNRFPLFEKKCCCQATSQRTASSISEMKFRNKRIFVKRDDELSQNGVTGNKVRKFASLNSPGALSGVNAIVYVTAARNPMQMLALAKHCKPQLYTIRLHYSAGPGPNCYSGGKTFRLRYVLGCCTYSYHRLISRNHS